MTAVPFEAAPHITKAAPAAFASGENPLQRVTATRCHARSCMLDLSRSRTHDAVLDILKAYKLSGNFHGNLETMLKHMGVFDMVSYQVEPNAALAFPDCRHVVFTLKENAPGDGFDDLIAILKDRIGFDVPWWVRSLRRLQPRAASADQMCRSRY
jgi:hypothetical protein